MVDSALPAQFTEIRSEDRDLKEDFAAAPASSPASTSPDSTAAAAAAAVDVQSNSSNDAESSEPRKPKLKSLLVTRRAFAFRGSCGLMLFASQSAVQARISLPQRVPR